MATTVASIRSAAPSHPGRELPSYASEANYFVINNNNNSSNNMKSSSSSSSSSPSPSPSSLAMDQPEQQVEEDQYGAYWSKQNDLKSEDGTFVMAGLKYDGSQVTDGGPCYYNHNHHVSPDTPRLTGSAMSFQNNNNSNNIASHYDTENRNECAYVGGSGGEVEEEEDQWFNGDHDLIGPPELSSTPPLSLHSNSKQQNMATSRQILHTDAPGIALYQATAATAATDAASSDPAANAAPSLTETPASSSQYERQDSASVQTESETLAGSNPTPNGSGNRGMRPILYSAIGSLENINATGSFKQRIRSKHKAKYEKEFSHQTLLPPPQSVKRKHNDGNGTDKHRSSLSIAVDASEKCRSGTGLSNDHHQPPPPLPEDSNDLKQPKTVNNQNDQSELPLCSRQPNSSIIKVPTIGVGATATDGPPSERSNSAKSSRSGRSSSKKVSINKENLKHKSKRPQELFRPSCDAYTPRMEKKKITYKPAEMRTPVQKMASPMGTLQRPNFRDALRRVAMIIHQHIVKIERRFEGGMRIDNEGLFKSSMKEAFSEEQYVSPVYKCTMVRIPMARPGMVYGLRQIKHKYEIPSESEIYEFAHQLFKSVQLSSECSIVCLIYIERLMEVAKVPLLASTWRPIFMCGLLLASKVWQDLSSWNIEFASVYPQFSLDAINRLELNFLREVKWDLYISTSLYAKYYFALRSLVEKRDFRQRYNRMVGGVNSVAQSEAMKISKRTEQVKEEAILQLSRSM